MAKHSIAAEFLAEVIGLPGMTAVGITRADCYRAMIDSGYDKATADLFAFSHGRASRPGWTAHPRAYELCRAVAADDRDAIAALIGAAA